MRDVGNANHVRASNCSVITSATLICAFGGSVSSTPRASRLPLSHVPFMLLSTITKRFCDGVAPHAQVLARDFIVGVKRQADLRAIAAPAHADLVLRHQVKLRTRVVFIADLGVDAIAARSPDCRVSGLAPPARPVMPPTLGSRSSSVVLVP